MSYLAHQIAFDEVLEGFFKQQYPRGYVLVVRHPQEFEEELRRFSLVGGSGVSHEHLLVIAFETRQDVADMITLFRQERGYSIFKGGQLQRGLPPESVENY